MSSVIPTDFICVYWNNTDITEQEIRAVEDRILTAVIEKHDIDTSQLKPRSSKM